MYSLVFLAVLSSCLAQDFYKLLGIPRDADKVTLQKSFKQLSKTYHPDKNINNKDAAEAVFMKASHAYEVLSDPVKRKIYDTFGEAAINDPYGFVVNVDPDDEALSDPDILKFFMGEDAKSEVFTGTEVIELFRQNIDMLEARHSNWMVLFYNSSCTECENIWEDYAKLAETLLDIAEIGAMNCDDEPVLCGNYHIDKHPMILFFPSDSREFHYYEGPREFKAMLEYMSDKMDNVAELVTQSNLEQFMGRDTPKVLFFVGGAVTPPYIKAVSLDFEGEMQIGEVRDTEKEIFAQFGVTQPPALLGIMDPPLRFVKTFDIIEIEIFLDNYINLYSSKDNTVTELTEDMYSEGTCRENSMYDCFLAMASSEDEVKDLILGLTLELASEGIQFYWLDKGKYPEIPKMLGIDKVLLRPHRRKYFPIDCSTVECVAQKAREAMSDKNAFKAMPGALNFNVREPDL